MSDPLLQSLREGHERFLAFVADVRPDLHRYCARMTGSVADGEDIVQETLARAYYALSEVEELPPLRPYLFAIAHRRALDHLRRYERRMGRALDAVAEPEDRALSAEDALASDEAVRAALSAFVELPPAQRSAVILKDVLGQSLEEIASLLQLSIPAVKAALHRGRTRLREQPASEPPRTVSPLLAKYAALFNARDWDALRAMLAEDVSLELVSRAQRAGRRQVSSYFTNYDRVRDFHLVPARLDGREVLAVYRDPADERPSYFVELEFAGEQVVFIRDFRYVPYIGADARFQMGAGPRSA